MPKLKFIRAEQLDNHCHTFAAWLRENDWKNDYKSVGVLTNEFYSSTGKAIARAVYDNKNDTFKVLIANR